MAKREIAKYREIVRDKTLVGGGNLPLDISDEITGMLLAHRDSATVSTDLHSATVFITGLSGSGKTFMSHSLSAALRGAGVNVILVSLDVVGGYLDGTKWLYNVSKIADYIAVASKEFTDREEKFVLVVEGVFNNIEEALGSEDVLMAPGGFNLGCVVITVPNVYQAAVTAKAHESFGKSDIPDEWILHWLKESTVAPLLYYDFCFREAEKNIHTLEKLGYVARVAMTLAQGNVARGWFQS